MIAVAELGQTTDPKALVPGDPEAVFRAAQDLDKRAKDVDRVGNDLQRIDTGGWTGDASEAFHEQHRTEVPRWFQGADSLGAAAQTLTDHANCLSFAQGQAQEAIRLWEQGEAATATARAAHATAVADARTRTEANAARGNPTVVTAPGFVDPGAEKRAQAVAILAEARRQLQESGDRGGQALTAEADLAPQDSQRQSDADFYGSIWDTVTGVGDGVANLVTDPFGAAGAVVDSVLHPVDTVKDMVAYDDFANGQGDRGLGTIVGEVGITVLTGGLGKLLHLARRTDGGDGPDTGGPRAPGGTAALPPKPRYEPTRNRVKLRKGTELRVFENADRDENGDFIGQDSRDRIPAQRDDNGNLVRVDPQTGRPDPDGMTVPQRGTYDISHNEGREWWRYKREAEAGGYDRARVIEDQNDPGRYHLETPEANRSHRFELPP